MKSLHDLAMVGIAAAMAMAARCDGPHRGKDSRLYKRAERQVIEEAQAHAIRAYVLGDVADELGARFRFGSDETITWNDACKAVQEMIDKAEQEMPEPVRWLTPRKR